MAQIAGDASNSIQDPPLTLDDLRNNSRFVVIDNKVESEGIIGVRDLNTGLIWAWEVQNPDCYFLFNTNSYSFSAFKKENAKYIDGNVFDSINTFSDAVNIFAYGDAISPQEYENSYKGAQGADPNQPDTIQEEKTPQSLFNKWSLIKHRGTPLNNTSNKESDVQNDYRKINLEQDLIGVKSPNTFYLINKLKEVAPSSYAYQYDFSDFALAKFNNKLPNNRLITLRRFATPVEDDIITAERIGKTEDGKKENVGLNFPPIAQAVTWFDEATGNNLNEILNLKYNLNYKSIESGVQEIQKTGEGGGLLNSWAQSSPFGFSFKSLLTGRNVVDQRRIEAEGNDFDPLKATYPNYVYGPYNVIKKMEIRDSGLEFTQEFKLTFEYKMRYFNGINPKVLFLDQFANILSLTYNSAPFWGGSVRYTGGNSQIIPPLGNLKFLADGKPGKFLKSVFNDAKGIFERGAGQIQTAIEGLKKGKIDALAPLVTNLIGGKLMDLVNTPQGGQTVQAFLSGEATGQWHVTIGNPLNPIAMIGNLICTGTNIIFDGPLGLQDFPENIKVEISLKPARPRDKADIESMFNCGRGRLYIEPHDDFTNGLDIMGEKGSPLNAEQKKMYAEQKKMLKRMSNG